MRSPHTLSYRRAYTPFCIAEIHTMVATTLCKALFGGFSVSCKLLARVSPCRASALLGWELYVNRWKNDVVPQVTRSLVFRGAYSLEHLITLLYGIHRWICGREKFGTESSCFCHA